jgi:hypothetical protein
MLRGSNFGVVTTQGATSTSPPPSTPAPPLNLPHLEHFSIPTGGVFIAFVEVNFARPLVSQAGPLVPRRVCVSIRTNSGKLYPIVH